jgi:uncharacterized protein YeaO (DUF488 family)
MAISIVRLGSARSKGEGIRIGTVRRPPRGVPKTEYAKRNYYDLWLPDLAPSALLVKFAQSAAGETDDWNRFVRRYRKEMAAPIPDRLIGLLAGLSQKVDLSVGCYCEDEKYCHRSVLRKLLVERGAKLAP